MGHHHDAHDEAPVEPGTNPVPVRAILGTIAFWVPPFIPGLVLLAIALFGGGSDAVLVAAIALLVAPLLFHLLVIDPKRASS